MSNRYQSFVSGTWRLITAIAQSVGVADANKIIATDSTGRIDSSLLPPGLGAATKVYLASEALVAGDFLNIWDDAGTLKVRKADASNARDANGFTLTAVTSGNNATVILQGLNTALTGLNPASLYFLGNAGAVTTTPSITNNAIIQELGYATAVTELNFEYNSPIIVNA
jgi:hypothetical protein